METNITPSDADTKYNISVYHGQIDRNELRFRLNNNNESTYILTKSLTDHWQDGHYHENIEEIYTIKTGWIVFLTLRKHKLIMKKYSTNSIITVEKGVQHKLFLSEDAVLHTIKNGEDALTDRHVSFELDKAISTSRIKNFLDKAKAKKGIDTIKHVGSCEKLHEDEFAEYSEGYRHFDNLIWQLPIWNTALFAGILSAYMYINFDSNARNIPINSVIANVALLVTALLFFITGYYALFRWRIHQRYTARKNAPRPPLLISRLFGGQFLLQFITGIQAATIILLLFKHTIHVLFDDALLVIPLVLLLAIITYLVESRLRTHPQKKYQDRS